MTRSRTSLLLGLPVALALAAGGAAAALAAADGIDVARPQTVVVGTPRGFAPTDRVDDARSGRAHSLLPAAPGELWRRELTGGIEMSPVIDDSGAVWVALGGPEVVKLGADGRQRWRRRIGSASAAAPPILTSDGGLAVVGVDAVLRRVSAEGELIASTPLGMRVSKGVATPLGLDDGSVVVAGDSGLVRVGPMGRELGRVMMEALHAGSLLRRGDAVLIVTSDGTVHEWRAPLPARELGSLGGLTDHGALLVARRTVVAVVGGRRVVALDLVTGSRSTLASEADVLAEFEGSPALTADGVLLVSSGLGELLGIDRHAVIVRRSALENLPMMFTSDAGAPLTSVFGRSHERSSPSLVVDGEGRIGFVRNTGKVGVMDDAGRVVVAEPRLCARPLVLLPAGQQRMLVACRSGTLAMYGPRK